jgi:hypothetical protein
MHRQINSINPRTSFLKIEFISAVVVGAVKLPDRGSSKDPLTIILKPLPTYSAQGSGSVGYNVIPVGTLNAGVVPAAVLVHAPSDPSGLTGQ